MNKREKKQRDQKFKLLSAGWSFDGSIFTHRELSPEGLTLEVAITLNQNKKIDSSKMIKQLMRKGR